MVFEVLVEGWQFDYVDFLCWFVVGGWNGYGFVFGGLFGQVYFLLGQYQCVVFVVYVFGGWDEFQFDLGVFGVMDFGYYIVDVLVDYVFDLVGFVLVNVDDVVIWFQCVVYCSWVIGDDFVDYYYVVLVLQLCIDVFQ